MNRLLLLCFTLPFLMLASSLPARAQDEDTTATAAAALKILDAYHAENPKPGERTLHIICWRPKDRPFAPDHRERLTRIMKHIQKFYADEMERQGFGRRSIELNFDTEDKLLTIHHAVGSANFADYAKPEGERVRRDCWPVLKKAGLNPDLETVLIFTNLSDWDPVKTPSNTRAPTTPAAIIDKGSPGNSIPPNSTHRTSNSKSPSSATANTAESRSANTTRSSSAVSPTNSATGSDFPTAASAAMKRTRTERH